MDGYWSDRLYSRLWVHKDNGVKWTPLDECVHTKLYNAKVDFTDDSEYKKLFGQQTELIERWVKKEEKRLPPSPPMSPFN